MRGRGVVPVPGLFWCDCALSAPLSGLFRVEQALLVHGGKTVWVAHGSNRGPGRAWDELHAHAQVPRNPKPALHGVVLHRAQGQGRDLLIAQYARVCDDGFCSWVKSRALVNGGIAVIDRSGKWVIFRAEPLDCRHGHEVDAFDFLVVRLYHLDDRTRSKGHAQYRAAHRHSRRARPMQYIRKRRLRGNEIRLGHGDFNPVVARCHHAHLGRLRDANTHQQANANPMPEIHV